MKWLATFLCLLVITSASAEESQTPEAQPPGVQVTPLPLITQCTTIAPDTMLNNNYGEEVFLWGKGSIILPNGRMLPGSMRMFLSADDKTYTVMFEVGELHCMIMSGDVKDMFPPEQKL